MQLKNFEFLLRDHFRFGRGADHEIFAEHKTPSAHFSGELFRSRDGQALAAAAGPAESLGLAVSILHGNDLSKRLECSLLTRDHSRPGHTDRGPVWLAGFLASAGTAADFSPATNQPIWLASLPAEQPRHRKAVASLFRWTCTVRDTRAQHSTTSNSKSCSVGRPGRVSSV